MKTVPASKSNFVLTFGYGNRKDYDSFINYLDEFHVACVVDVRLNPRAWSRKWYGEAIEKLCASKNICYLSKASLGNTSGCSHWIPLEKKEADQTLLEISKILNSGNILLLCAELDSSKCHRSEVASRLGELASASVKHLK
jgi:uncharacterized protein (DUF488 family)